MVHLYFDREGLTTFAQLLNRLVEDADVLKRQGHVHIRDEMHPRAYHLQQDQVDSKDILILALPEPSGSTEGAEQ
jgi:hypothetical protein